MKKQAMKVVGLLVVIGWIFVSAALAADAYLASYYGSMSGAATTTVSVAFSYTNNTDYRVGLGSVMVSCPVATNLWTISVVNNSGGITNVIKSGTLSTLTAAASTLVYEGYGTIPLGAKGVVLFTGSVYSNTTSPKINWNVNTLVK